jgi:DNA-binding transcriptional ArsR family regulator
MYDMNQENMMDANTPVLELAQALADPLRLALLQSLMSGPATVSELMSLSGATQSNVSNHLALLRERGLVRATRQGRQMVYELRDASVGQLVESLAQVAGGAGARATNGSSLPPERGENAGTRFPQAPAAVGAPPFVQKSAPLVRARTCYDHLAGRLGVALFDALVARGALQAPAASRGLLELGPAAAEVFGALGIDLAAARRERRKFATACLDWTERRPHLGGALGAAVWARCVERGWVVRQPGTRAIILTDGGKQGLRDLLAVELQEGVA